MKTLPESGMLCVMMIGMIEEELNLTHAIIHHSLVVNIMTDSVMTAPPGKSGIRLKREIWTWDSMRARIAQAVERRARNPEVWGSNPGSGRKLWDLVSINN